MEVGTNFDSWPCRDSNDDMKSETKIGGVLAPLTATGSPLSSVSPAQLLPPPELKAPPPIAAAALFAALPPSGCIYSLRNLLQHSTIIWSRKKSWPLLEICHDYCPSKAAILSAALCWEMSKRKWPNWLASSSRARSSKARVATKRSWIGARVRTEGAGVRHCTVQWIINHIILPTLSFFHKYYFAYRLWRQFENELVWILVRFWIASEFEKPQIKFSLMI